MAGSAAAAAVVGMEESDSTCQLLILGTPPSDRQREGQTVEATGLNSSHLYERGLKLFCPN